VREGLGIVIYPRSAFPAELDGSAFVPLVPPLKMPFHLAYRGPPRSA
jgi:DNA-binding transcriptional LysR family regulator